MVYIKAETAETQTKREVSPDNEIIRITEKYEIDALIPLEIVDWTLSEYVRDSVSSGRSRVILEMGHFNVEEPGMKHMVTWIPGLIGENIPVKFIQSGDAFSYYECH